MSAVPITEADLVAFADDALDPARTAEVAAHLEANPDEARRVSAWRGQNAALRAVLDPVAAEPVPERLAAALKPGRRPPGWLMPAAAAAVVAFALGLGAGRMLAGGGSPAAATLAENGLDAYRVYVGEVRHPVEVGAEEEAHLIAWLTKRLQFPVRVPDLSADGLHLVGGRLLPVAGGEPAAMLMYEGAAGDRYTLLIARSGEGASTAFRYAGEDGVGAFYWIDGEVGYVLTGPDERVRLLSIATAVYDQIS